MAVNTRVLVGSLVVAVAISLGGGYALSRSSDAPPPDDDITIESNGTFVEPGLATNDEVVGEALPTVTLRNEAGDDVSTDSLTGVPLVINVWSTTCQPCKRELPAFAALHRRFGDVVRFVGVNSGGDSVDEAREFAARYGATYESFKDVDGAFLVTLGIVALPYTLFVAADGTIVAQKGVELSEETIRATIVDELLGS